MLTSTTHTRSDASVMRLSGVLNTRTYQQVRDAISSALAVRRERALGGCPAGFDIVSALCRRWGNTPTSTGKTVWARIGPHDTFTEITSLRR